MFLPCEKLHPPGEIFASGGGLLVESMDAPHLLNALYSILLCILAQLVVLYNKSQHVCNIQHVLQQAVQRSTTKSNNWSLDMMNLPRVLLLLLL